ncbi:MAG: LarC family nickel insertion protein, partial [Spirochaetota bacterium]
QTELTTPTGAAIIRSVAASFGEMPRSRIRKTGYGAGTREMEIPNLLRIFECDAAEESSVIKIEANIDDMNPEIYSFLYDNLFLSGALDVTAVSALMKKNRPGNILTVLCRAKDADSIKKIILTETTTFGLRFTAVDRMELDRSEVEFDLGYAKVKGKAGYLEGRLIKISPEYSSCAKAAAVTGFPLVRIYQDFHAAAAGRMDQDIKA